MRESLRLCDRYVKEVVLAFGLCPWAEPALRAGRVAKRVFPVAEPDITRVLAAIDAISSTGGRPDPAPAGQPARDEDGEGDVEVALFLFPRHTGGWSAFDALAERVRRADQARREPGTLPPFLVATFHPDSPAPDVLASETLSHVRQLTLFLRRSPDPMLQLVRTRTMDRLKSHHPNASEALATATFASLSSDGGALARALSETVRDIHHDRDQAHDR